MGDQTQRMHLITHGEPRRRSLEDDREDHLARRQDSSDEAGTLVREWRRTWPHFLKLLQIISFVNGVSMITSGRH